MNAILHGWPQRLKTISTTDVAIRSIRRVTLSTFGDNLRVKFVYADYFDIPIVKSCTGFDVGQCICSTGFDR